MRSVVQRVSSASVSVAGCQIATIERGLLVLLAVEQQDGPHDMQYMIEKVAGLRIFCDAQGLMNLSVADIGGAVLVVSQFTLMGDVRRGRRPSFTAAAPPVIAEQLYVNFCQALQERGLPVQHGQFQADMQVALVNDGPVTILLDSRKRF